MALSTALALLQNDPQQLYRRLSVICLEDVSLMDTYPVLIWLIMAGKHHTCSTGTTYLILQIVNFLCNCTQVFVNTVNSKITLSHEILQVHKKHDILLALFYRTHYGGMQGDIELLNSAIYHYSIFNSAIVKTEIAELDVTFTLEILDAAIDQHPFPYILDNINKKSGIEKAQIANTIWYAESALNFRKPESIENSAKYKNSEVWRKITPHLDYERQRLN